MSNFSEDDDKKPTTLGDAAQSVGTAALAGAVASLATDPNPSHALAWGIGGAIPGVFSYLKSRYDEWQHARQVALFRGFAGQGGDQQAAELLVRLVEEPNAKNLILEAIRRANEALDDAVVPTLGKLMREFLASGVPIDAYYRGVMRMLCDLTSDEYESMRALVNFAASNPLATVVTELHAQSEGVYIQDPARPNMPNDLPAGLPCAHSRRLFKLLKDHDLAFDNHGGFADTISGPDVMLIRREIADRLRALFCA